MLLTLICSRLCKWACTHSCSIIHLSLTYHLSIHESPCRQFQTLYFILHMPVQGKMWPLKSGARGWGRWFKWRKFYKEQSWTRYHCSRQVSRLLETWVHHVFLRLDHFDYCNFEHSWNCRVLQLPLERVVNEKCVCAPAHSLLGKMLYPQMHWSVENSSF